MNVRNAGLFACILFFTGAAAFAVLPLPFRSDSVPMPVSYQNLAAQVATATASDVSVAGGFEDGVIAYNLLDVRNPLVKLNDFANRWSNTNGMNAPLLSLDSADARQGTYSLKVTLPGAPYGNTHDDRAEVVNVRDSAGKEVRETPASGTKYYAISVKLDPSWQAPVFTRGRGQWAMFLQLHAPYSFTALSDDEGGIQSVFTLQATDRFFFNLRGGNVMDKINNVPSPFPSINELSKNDLALGHWVDFVFKITFATDTSGGATIWRHDEGKPYFQKVADTQNRPTLFYNPDPAPGESKFGTGHVWRSGLYRNPQTSVTNVLWLDGFTRADSFAGAVSNAFPELAGAPIIDCTPAPECADTTAPRITLLGANPLTLTQGEVFTDPGATATDAVDGSLTAEIQTNSTSLNVDTPGTYTVTYRVSDAAGNSATATRTVSVTTLPDVDISEPEPDSDNAAVETTISDEPTISIASNQPIDQPVADTITFTVVQRPVPVTGAPTKQSAGTTGQKTVFPDPEKITVVAIEYTLDGALMHTTETFPDTFSVDTATLTNDFHTLLLKYHYRDGSTRDSISVFRVDNHSSIWKAIVEKLNAVFQDLKRLFSRK